MLAKRTNRCSTIAAAVFTSIVAPTLVAIFTTAIKGDTTAKATSMSPPLDQSAIVRREAQATPAVTLLPPTMEHSRSSWTSAYARTAQPQRGAPEPQTNLWQP
jgi:hypothetical protein